MEYAGCGTVSKYWKITIPDKVREKFGIEAGTVLDIYYDGNMIVIKPKKETDRKFIDLADQAEEKTEN
jgi:AbrB family looped-hinge helix DNA binding protein